MSEENTFRQSPELAALVEDLRMHRVDRRTFLMKAAASGITMASASALATDVLAQTMAPAPRYQITPGTALPPAKEYQLTPNTASPGGTPVQVPAKVEIRIPSTINLPKSDLDRLTAEFNAKLVDLIKSRSGGTAARQQVLEKLVPVTELQSVKVDVKSPSSN
jgi:hypothetical protein